MVAFGEAPLTPAQARQYSPLTLAFYGDAVYEMLVRRQLVGNSNMPVYKLHHASVAKVRASFQAQAAERIQSKLTEEESDILRRGRNANVTVPKSSTPAEYHLATGLEALFGYLSLIGEDERLTELFDCIIGGD